ncbi:MAG: PEP/pyruvate-binding domain-containing protein [Phycisphaerae bacterium]
MNDASVAAQVARRLEDHLLNYPQLAERIHRQLLIALHTRGIVTIDSIQDQAQRDAGSDPPSVNDDPNQAERDRWDDNARDSAERIVKAYVTTHFTVDDVDDLVNLTVKREGVHSLEDVANLPNVSHRQLADEVHRFCELPLGETQLAPAEVVGTRVALTRHFISDHLEFLGLAKGHLRIRDFDDITRRMVGRDDGIGRIGGKAGGMILAYRILADAERDTEPFLPIAMPESYFLRSDVVEDFLQLNRLDEYKSQKYKPIDQVTREYSLIKGVFRNGDFPIEIKHKLWAILAEIGTHPLIVRSSSLLEDRIGTAFCGKYASVFLANQGSPEHRFRALLGAIAEVYASIMAPDAILYRQEHNLIDYVEEMAVLIQKVVGTRIGPYFLPVLAGVGFSRNDYRWAPRITREGGLGRLVMGLGTRAVDRSGPDYPRMVALAAPTLRPESTAREIRRCAQDKLDVIDLEHNCFASVRRGAVLAACDDIPMLDRIVSIYRDDELFAPTGACVDADPSTLCITFEKLLTSTPFPERLRSILSRLEDAYGVPMDIEFASDGQKLYILQCRTQSQADECEPVDIPRVPDEAVIFDAVRYVRTGLIENIEYVLYVDPDTYDAVPTRQRRIGIARAIGRLNHALDRRSFILVGPGRWGSNDIRVGVPVRYADINRSCMLIEVARRRGGFLPEVSFGTHFFQDLVEAGIHYLPLYPDTDGTRFNQDFLCRTPNALADIVPADADFATDIRVIHVPAVAQGRTLTVAMDATADRAIAYLQ